MATCRAYYPVYTTLISGLNIPYNQGYRPRITKNNLVDIIEESSSSSKFMELIREKITQTYLRESETQTDPYGPDPKEPVDRGLEIFTLGWLSWNNGLPAGFREAVIIERARQRRAWEHAIPLPADATAERIRDMIIEAIDINEWNYREAELAALCSIREEIAEKFMKEIVSNSKIKYDNIVVNYTTIRSEKKDAALKKVRTTFYRDIRKLVYKRDHVARTYRKWNIVEELTDKTSEWYGPQQRFGVDPRRWNEEIHPEFRFWNVFSHMELARRQIKSLENTGRVSKFDFEKKSKPVKSYKTLCVKETRWTAQELDNLYNLLRNMRRSRTRATHAMPSKFKTKSVPPEVPYVQHRTSEDENDGDFYQVCLYLQKTIKGRAIQTVMFEGRVRCQELIDELKSTHALQNYLEAATSETRHTLYKEQREKEVEIFEQKRKKELFDALEGKTVSDVLDFLSKELIRLQNERTIHAAALMADRERHKREAQEAGRRQVEGQRLREHNEMLKQVYKINQNSADMVQGSYVYQNNPGMNHNTLAEALGPWISGKIARRSAKEYAQKIDRAAYEAEVTMNEIQMMEIVADLVHNFALPESEKVIVRKRLANRQQSMLATCHDEIYSNIEELARGPRSASGTLEPILRPKKHVTPPARFIRFFRLKRENSSSVGEKNESSSEEVDARSGLRDSSLSDSLSLRGLSFGDIHSDGSRRMP